MSSDELKQEVKVAYFELNNLIDLSKQGLFQKDRDRARIEARDIAREIQRARRWIESCEGKS